MPIPFLQGHVPQPGQLLDYVSRPPPTTHRTYCTVVPNLPPNQASGSSAQRSRHPISYTLYLEHLGTLVPILEAHKRSSKIRQSFTISLPNGASLSSSSPQPQRLVLDTTEGESLLEASDNGQTNPSQLRLYGHESHNSLNTESGVQFACREDDSDSPKHTQAAAQGEAIQRCVNMPDNPRQLAEVTSNVMASKFKIQGLSDKLPSDMGSVVIKTSFLHIQPRKVMAYLPHPELADSGIDTDSSSDESSGEESGSDVFVEQETAMESLVSMEDLLLPRTFELESQSIRPVEAQALRPHFHSRGQRISTSDSHLQIHSKTPTWNEQHMIYQLDFGGRVTTKSAKNFQLELDGEQVRILPLSKYILPEEVYGRTY